MSDDKTPNQNKIWMAKLIVFHEYIIDFKY